MRSPGGRLSLQHKGFGRAAKRAVCPAVGANRTWRTAGQPSRSQSFWLPHRGSLRKRVRRFKDVYRLDCHLVRPRWIKGSRGRSLRPSWLGPEPGKLAPARAALDLRILTSARF